MNTNGVGGMIGGFAVGIILAVIIYFAFIRDTTKTKPESCPEAKECPEAKKCPECPLCQVCEDKECPACEDRHSILGFPIKRGGVLLEEIDNMENKLTPLIHKMICGLLNDPQLISEIERNKDVEVECSELSRTITRDFDKIIVQLENMREPGTDVPGLIKYMYGSNMHGIVAGGLATIRDNIIREVCPSGKKTMNGSDFYELFKKIRENFCDQAGTVPTLEIRNFFL